MEKLTAQQILDIVEDAGLSVSDFAYGSFNIPKDFVFSAETQEKIDAHQKAQEAWKSHPDHKEFAYYNRDKASQEFKDLAAATQANHYPYDATKLEYLNHLGLGPYEEVEEYGGEDQGSTWYRVKYFTNHDVYIRTDGYYQSHHGTEFEDGYGEEVVPVEKTITVYESKN